MAGHMGVSHANAPGNPATPLGSSKGGAERRRLLVGTGERFSRGGGPGVLRLPALVEGESLESLPPPTSHPYSSCSSLPRPRPPASSARRRGSGCLSDFKKSILSDSRPRLPLPNSGQQAVANATGVLLVPGQFLAKRSILHRRPPHEDRE